MRKTLISTLAILFLLAMPVRVFAQSLNQDDTNSIYDDTVWYDLSGGSGAGVCLSGGTLPSAVPEPYNKIFTAAADKFSVPPAFLAALFYAGEHGSSWPDPPPPYGHGNPWASSGVSSPGGQDWPTQPPGPGAAGPFQFEYGTWLAHRQDGNGDGIKDVEDLWDAAFSGSDLLKALGADTTDINKLHAAAYHYNGSGQAAQVYADKVMAAYQKFSGGSPSATAGGTCTTGSVGGCANKGDYSALVNQGANFAGIDQGIDFTPANVSGFDICAPESGTITQADQTGHIFLRTSGQAEVLEKLDQKPNAQNSSQYIYYVEIIRLNSNIKVGAHVNKGDVIGHNNQSPGIEVGWARDANSGFLCAIGATDGSQTQCGISFNGWIKDVSSGKIP